MASITKNGAPSKHTVGAVGDTCTNTLTGDVYECVYVYKFVIGDKIRYEYEWEKINKTNNDGSGYEETDARLDALEAGRVTDKQEINAKVEALEDTVVSNKDATDLDIYRIDQHMTLLDKKIDDGVAEVYGVAETVDGKIAEVEADVDEFERNLNTDVQQFKIDTNAAMTAHKNEVSEVVEGFNSQLAQNAEKNKINIFTHVENENSNITELLNNLFKNENICIDLMNGKFVISDEVTMSYNSSIINGTLDITSNGCLSINKSFCKVENINFNGFNSEVKDCIKVTKGYVKLFNLKFKDLNTGISIDAENGGFYDVKMDKIDARNVETAIYISSYGGWLADISITNSFLTFTKYGIVMTRGDIEDVHATSQLSHCNVDNVTFLDLHPATNEGVGLYLNCGWNNFSNLSFFYDGHKSKPFYAIKFDVASKEKVNWDIIQCIRSNSFSNLFVEGYISKDAFHLNSFNNVKFINSVSSLPLDRNYWQMSNTSSFSNISTNIKSVSSLMDYYTWIGSYPDITFKKDGKSIVITNNSNVNKTISLVMEIDDNIKTELKNNDGTNIMTQIFLDNNGKDLANNDYIVSIIEINKTNHLPNSTVCDFVANTGINTSKGRIVNACFFLNDSQKNTIINSSYTIAIRLNFELDVGESVKIKDIRVFPYITTALNSTNLEWQNNYLI